MERTNLRMFEWMGRRVMLVDERGRNEFLLESEPGSGSWVKLQQREAPRTYGSPKLEIGAGATVEFDFEDKCWAYVTPPRARAAVDEYRRALDETFGAGYAALSDETQRETIAALNRSLDVAFDAGYPTPEKLPDLSLKEPATWLDVERSRGVPVFGWGPVAVPTRIAPARREPAAIVVDGPRKYFD